MITVGVIIIYSLSGVQKAAGGSYNSIKDRQHKIICFNLVQYILLKHRGRLDFLFVLFG